MALIDVMPARTPLIGADGRVSREWLEWFSQVQRVVDGTGGDYLLRAGGTMAGNIAMDGNKVTGLAAASGNGEALRYEQLGGASATELGYVAGVTSAIQTQLAARLLKAGGTMTGDLVLAGDPNAALKAATKQYVDTRTPAGVILPYGGTSAPTGYLLCNGSAVSRTTYSALYTAIGDAVGEGDGSTTFNVPDLRGRFMRGVDGGEGTDPDAGSRTAMATGGNTGDAVGSVQADAMQGHFHPKGQSNDVSAGGTFSVMSNVAGGTQSPVFTGSPSSDGSSGTPRTSSETRPKNAYVNFIIKV